MLLKYVKYLQKTVKEINSKTHIIYNVISKTRPIQVQEKQGVTVQIIHGTVCISHCFGTVRYVLCLGKKGLS